VIVSVPEDADWSDPQKAVYDTVAWPGSPSLIDRFVADAGTGFPLPLKVALPRVNS
jgi:hypothetical protein